MQLTPNSWGSPLVEFNPCHNPKDGKFATRTAGRCAADVKKGLALGKAKMGPERYMATVQKVAARRRLARQRQGELPRHLRLDAERAARDERATVTYTPGPVSAFGSSARRGSREVRLAQYATKGRTLAVLRHEIGHITPLSLGRGGPVVSGERLNPKVPSQRTYLEEVRAWKNAIIAARGRIDIQRDVRDALQSYWGPAAKSLLPRAPSLKKLVADAFVAAGQMAPVMSGVGWQGWKSDAVRKAPGAMRVLMEHPEIRVAVRRQQVALTHARKAHAAKLKGHFDKQMASLERFARVVRRAAAIERRARRKVA